MTHRMAAWGSFVLSSVSLVLALLLRATTCGLTLSDVRQLPIVLGLIIVGALVLLRRPENRLGWVFAVGGTLWAISGVGLVYGNPALNCGAVALPGAIWAAWFGSWISDLAFGIFATFGFLLFPSGRLPSPRWRVVAWATVISLAVVAFVQPFMPGPLSQVNEIANPLGVEALGSIAWLINAAIAMWFLCVIASLISVFVRYRSAPPVERQQLKWIAYVVVLIALFYLGGSVDGWIRGRTAFGSLLFVGMDVLIALFPLAVGVSILRYRLFDIDVIIRRTLIYTVLTATLATVYVGSVVLLQQVFAPLIGATDDFSIVVSTLAIAALFHPLRRRTQSVIDRRFYRRTYDAQKTLQAFSARLREETDLAQLSDDLIAIVQETTQPQHVSLWLKPEAMVGRALHKAGER